MPNSFSKYPHALCRAWWASMIAWRQWGPFEPVRFRPLNDHLIAHIIVDPAAMVDDGWADHLKKPVQESVKAQIAQPLGGSRRVRQIEKEKNARFLPGRMIAPGQEIHQDAGAQQIVQRQDHIHHAGGDQCRDQPVHIRRRHDEGLKGPGLIHMAQGKSKPHKAEPDHGQEDPGDHFQAQIDRQRPAQQPLAPARPHIEEFEGQQQQADDGAERRAVEHFREIADDPAGIEHADGGGDAHASDQSHGSAPPVPFHRHLPCGPVLAGRPRLMPRLASSRHDNPAWLCVRHRSAAVSVQSLRTLARRDPSL